MRKIIIIVSIILASFFLSSCEEEKLKVSFDVAGGQEEISSQHLNYNDLIIKPLDPNRAGYDFLYWAEKETLKEWDFTVDKVTSNLILVAQWEIKKDVFLVSFDLAGGQPEIDDLNVEKGEKITEPAEPTKTGYTFIGWLLTDELYDFDNQVNQNLVLVADWRINEYNIKFLVDGVEVDSTNADYGSKIVIPEEPQKDGYTFIGWLLADELYDFNNPINQNLVLVADWNINEYNIKFLVDGVEVDSTSTDYGSKIVIPEEPLKDGYTFSGWFLDDELYNFEGLVKEDLVLEARFTINNFLVSFIVDELEYHQEVVDYQTKVTRPTDPEKEGYIFSGWFKVELEFDFNSLIETDLILVAKWEKAYPETISIFEFNRLPVGESGYLKGVITSFGPYYYFSLEDDSGAILIKVSGYSFSSLYSAGYNVGDEVLLLATKRVTRNLEYGFTQIDELVKLSTNKNLSEVIDLTNESLEEDNLSNYLVHLVKIDEFLIINKEEILNGVVFTLLSNADQKISLVWDSRIRINNLVEVYDFKVGDIIKIEGALLFWDQKFLLAVDNIEQITKIGETDVVGKTAEFEIFYLNDTHGAILYNPQNSELGMARIANYIKNLKTENSIFVTGGDILQGQIISNSNRGALFIEIFNNLNLDAFVIGNHEFDWGLDVILPYFDPATMGIKANFPLLGANVIEKATGQRPNFIDSHTIIQRGDYKIGIVGVIGDGLESSISTPKVKDYYFSDAYFAVKETVELIADEVDFIIVVNHDDNSTFNNGVAKLPKVAAIFNGHSHQSYSGYIDGIPFIQSKDNGKMVGHVELEFESAFKVLTLTRASAENVYDHNYLTQVDSEIEAIINGYYQDISHLYEEAIITAGAGLSRDWLANHAAKLMATVSDSVFAFQNYGGTRVKIDSQSLITAADIFQVFP
ncbi:MAG: hypothetical protein GX149_05920, partial [Acholeplasmataceae bacterium]|nr:hypothetical protein [Acholeplasmataceae bacterium]